MDTVLNTVEDVKHKLTDAEYKALMDGLAEVHNAPQQPRYLSDFMDKLREVLPTDMGPMDSMDDVVNAVETLTHNRDLWELESDGVERFVDWFWKQAGTSRPQADPVVWEQLELVKKHIKKTNRELQKTNAKLIKTNIELDKTKRERDWWAVVQV